jgi:hypothetical protein
VGTTDSYLTGMTRVKTMSTPQSQMLSACRSDRHPVLLDEYRQDTDLLTILHTPPAASPAPYRKRWEETPRRVKRNEDDSVECACWPWNEPGRDEDTTEADGVLKMRVRRSTR